MSASHPTNITHGSALEWRREREAADGGRAKPTDREAEARTIWQNARTPELRAHLRRLHPDLFAQAPDPKPRRAPESATISIPYPEGFHCWPLDKKNEWWAEAYKLYAAAQKWRRS